MVMARKNGNGEREGERERFMPNSIKISGPPASGFLSHLMRIGAPICLFGAPNLGAERQFNPRWCTVS